MSKEASISTSRDVLRARIPAFLTLAVMSGLAVAGAVTLPKAFSSEPVETPVPKPEIPMNVVMVEPGHGLDNVLVQQCVPSAPAAEAVVCTEYILQVPAGNTVNPGDQLVITA